MNNKGITLLECVASMVILGILSMISINLFIRYNIVSTKLQRLIDEANAIKLSQPKAVTGSTVTAVNLCPNAKPINGGKIAPVIEFGFCIDDVLYLTHLGSGQTNAQAATIGTTYNLASCNYTYKGNCQGTN